MGKDPETVPQVKMEKETTEKEKLQADWSWLYRRLVAQQKEETISEVQFCDFFWTETPTKTENISTSSPSFHLHTDGFHDRPSHQDR